MSAPSRLLSVLQRFFPLFLLACLGLALSGCASAPPTVRSEVTSFHDWPADLNKRSFAFQQTKEQENNLEHRTYENLVRDQLLRLGFSEAQAPQSAALKVSMQYGIQGRDVRVVEPVYTGPPPMWGPAFGPRWGYPGFYSPFYDPFWYGPVQMMDRSYELYTRSLRITITNATDGRQLFNVLVVSQGGNNSLPAIMPYLVQSAFTDFPGPNGVPRRIELQVGEPASAPAGKAP